MQRHRVLIAFGIAWLSAFGLSWWVYKKSTAPQVPRDIVSIVAAARDIAVGKRLQAEDLKLVSLERKDLPKGAFFQVADIVDRTVTVPVASNETVLNTKVAAKGSGEGLTALIEPGSRAVSVQVNEISGVSGFIQPGTRVDILFTRVFANGDAATTTLLQNVRVIAYGRQFDPGSKLDPREASKPTVATLLVSQEQAEKLVLAAQRGKIQLVLRNSLDNNVTEAPSPVRAADLGIGEPSARPAAAPVRPRTVLVEPRPAPAPPAPTIDNLERQGHVVKIFRGDKVTETRFQ